MLPRHSSSILGRGQTESKSEPTMTLNLTTVLDLLGTAALASLFPALVGLAVGRLWRQRRGPLRGWASLALWLLVMPPAPFLLPLGALRIGLWDQIWITWFGCAGFVAGSHGWIVSWGRREWLLVAGGVVVAMALMEVGARLLLPPPVALFKGPDQLRMLRLSQRSDLQADDALVAGPFPDADQATYAARVSGSEQADHRVLHIGDSMVYGLGVPQEETFVSQLDRRDDSTAHVNAGFVATGLDFYLLVAEAWMTAQTYDAVHVYLFLGNDLDDMERRYHFCRDDRLLSYQGTDIVRNCPTPSPRHLSWTRLSGSPPPYLLRAGALFSQAARHLSLLHLRLGGHLGGPDLDEQLHHAGLVLSRLKEMTSQRGIRLNVVLLPVRGHFEDRDGPSEERHRRVLTLCHERGIPVQDSWPLFEEIVRARGLSSVFLDHPPGDPHLNREGHRIMAELLGR